MLKLSGWSRLTWGRDRGSRAFLVGGPLRRRDARDVEPCEIHRSSWRTSPRDRFSANRGLGRPREANVRPLFASCPRARGLGGEGGVGGRRVRDAQAGVPSA